MGTWNIWHKDGSQLKDDNGKTIVIKSLQYSGEWMGSCNITTDIENEAPINFQIGDYIIYRRERFEINYDPGKLKAAKKNMSGSAFKYSGVTFNSMTDELVRSEFLDVVLNDNEMHYTSLPKFSFYIDTLDDLADRLQANMNEQYGEGVWHFYTRNKSRSVGSTGRGCDETKWNKYYGDGIADNEIESTSITASSQSCWDILGLVNSQFDVNFIVRERDVFIGTTGIVADHIFQYGLGNGLYELEEATDSDQSVITRLRAYGNTTNLPTRFYAEMGARCKAVVTTVKEKNASYRYVSLELDIAITTGMFTDTRQYKTDKDGEWITDDGAYAVRVSVDDKATITGYIRQSSDDESKSVFYSEYTTEGLDTGDETSSTAMDSFISNVAEGSTLYFISGYRKSKFPSSNIHYGSELPNNMSITTLMLPGFPNKSLNQWWSEQDETTKNRINPTGRDVVFSEEQYRPYIESPNKEKIGVRPASVYFDNDNDKEGLKDIYPTIEEMKVGDVRIDEIDTGTEETVTDDGVFKDGEKVPNFDIYLKSAINFDIKSLMDDDFQINMKDGMCGGRSFNVAGATKCDDGRWQLRLERVKDSDLELYFPYKDFPIKAGDHFVLTGIEMPEEYVEYASEELLRYAIAKLFDNDYTRKTYTPKVDEIFMARNHDAYEEDETGKLSSLYLDIKEGDILEFKDADLALDTRITINSLSIKEQEGKIPTYEVTLKEEKEVSTITKIVNQVSSIVSGSLGGGLTNGQINSMIESHGKEYFLSKLSNDKANGLIQFLKGIGIGTSYGIDESGYAKLGEVLLDLLSSYDFNYSEQTGFAFTKRTDGKYKLSLTDLEVWGRAIFNQLEIRKLSYVGGNYIFSPAGSKIVCVQSGTEGIMWTYYRCYYLADDGTTATQNLWSVGDLALCEEFNVVNHADNTVSANKRYWRKVVAVSSANEVITDDNGNELYGGQKFGYVDLSMRNCETGSDAPAAGDTIACVGNVSDTDRQNVITINTVGDDAPAIIQYSGINTYSLTDKVVTKLSPKGNVIKGELYTEDGKNVKENIGTLQEEMSGMSNSVSEVKQTAEKLSLTVTRTAVRDRNLLANSYVSLASTLYGFCTREVSLEKGKTYTLSVKGYSVASGGELKVYVFAEDSEGNWTWSNSVSITDTTETTASVTFSDVPSSGTYHVRCFSAPSGSNKLVFVRYIQLEEGEVATPWSMNESDPAAYGNLLPDMGNNQWSYEDNVTKKDGVSLPDGNYYMTYHVENTETDDEDAIWLDSTFYPGNGESYTLSFWAKGSGTMNVWIDSACVYAITSEGLQVTAADGLVSFQLTTDWKRYWVTWSTNVSDGQPREVNVMQVAGGSDVTAAGFKLEPYGRMTEYTQEQITGEDLLGTGIDIENKKITVTADQFTIQNNHGSKTFSVDANGLVTMNHIAVGGMINKCPVDVTKAKFATLFDTWQDIATNHWYGRPKMEQMYGIYYINEATGLSQTGMPLTLYMPSVYVNPDGQYYGDVFDDDGNLSNTLLRNVRSLVGNTILIYNESSEDIAINGMSPYFVDVWQSSSSAKAVTLQAASAPTQTKGDTASDATDGLDKPIVDGDISPNERYVGRKRNELTVTLLGGKHHFVSLTCVCEVGHLGWENIYWLVNYGQAMNT